MLAVIEFGEGGADFVNVLARERRESRNGAANAADPGLRIGASEIVLRGHLPELLARVQAHHPGLRVPLRSGFQAQMEAALQNQEIDLAITWLESRPPPGIQCLRLVRIPLVLLAPKSFKIKSAAALRAEDV